MTRILAIAGAIVAIAASVSAQGHSNDNNGATVTRIGYCQTFGDQGQQLVCVEEMDVSNLTVTPSGNLNNQDHVRLRFTIIEPGLTFTNTQRGNFHALFMDGAIHELGSNVRGHNTLDFGDDFVVECSYLEQYHFANDEVQYDRFETDCF